MDKTRKHRTVSLAGRLLLLFLIAFAVGTLALYLPACNLKPLKLLDAMFVSVSSLTATGLMSVPAATQFSILGQIILLILIQIGGLLVIISVILLLRTLATRLHVRERMSLKRVLGTQTRIGTGKLIKRIVIITATAELVGTAICAFAFIPIYGAGKGLWYGLFHAVSAFCNSGIDLISDASMAGGARESVFVTNPGINIGLSLLTIAGGLGFLTWIDLTDTTFGWKRGHEREGLTWRGLKITTRIVLISTASLLFFGTLVFAIVEWKNPDTIGSLSVGGKLAASFFESATARSGGFYTFSQAAMHDSSKLFASLLMVIGAGPAGTGGGLRITTVVVMILIAYAVIRREGSIHTMHRRISARTAGIAVTICMGFTILLFMGVFIMSELEPHAMTDLIFECSSALGSSGLTTGITDELCGISKVILMILMTVGRIGPVMIALLLGTDRGRKDKTGSLPEDIVIIG